MLKDIASYFGTTPTVVNLSVAFYSLAVAFTPLWWSYFSEQYGRRAIYLVSFFLLAIFNIVGAVSVDIGMFIAMRVLAGGACASVQAVGAGTIADLWEVKERGQAMGLFFLGPMLGPLISPVIGGAVSIKWGWRSTQWVMVIYGFLVFILVLFLLPETSNIQIRRKDSNEKAVTTSSSSKTGNQKSSVSTIINVVIAPIKVVGLLRFMPVLITVYYNAVTFASYYLVNITIQIVFSSSPYHFSALIVGLTYIPSALGAILGSLFGGRWTDYIMHREAKRAGRVDENGNLQFIPQDRMRENIWIAVLMYPAALVWFGWVADKHVFWFVLVSPLFVCSRQHFGGWITKLKNDLQCLSTFFYSLGMMVVSNVMTTMLTEFVPKRSSTGVAVNNLLRNTLACVALIVASPLTDAIGAGWLLTIAAFICWLSALALIPMKQKADQWSREMAEKLPKLSL